MIDSVSGGRGDVECWMMDIVRAEAEGICKCVA